VILLVLVRGFRAGFTLVEAYKIVLTQFEEVAIPMAFAR
jgi:hypothetical protein